MGASMAIEGAADAPVFEACVEKVLAPSLARGRVVVLDRLGAHRPQRIRGLIEGRGCELVFPPSYSPDLNPMEEAFPKIKNLVRKAGERTREELDRAMAGALSAATLHDVAGWLAHCGRYESRGQYS
ncbi:MAG: transposase [Actinomycetota bacterium]|nr:transposase [Actinomycetota bacterium]